MFDRVIAYFASEFRVPKRLRRLHPHILLLLKPFFSSLAEEPCQE